MEPSRTIPKAIYILHGMNLPSTAVRVFDQPAHDRLQVLTPLMQDLSPDPNLVFKIFADIDAVFFSGCVYENVHMRIKTLNSLGGDAGKTEEAGVHSRRVCITLDKAQMGRPLNRVVGTLLHEMLHAWLLITCKDDHRQYGGRNDHRMGFLICLAILQRRLRELFGPWNVDLSEGGKYHLEYLSNSALKSIGELDV